MTAPTLADALRLIIQWNRDHATDQYGDPNKAESWACVRTARAALAAADAAKPQGEAVPDKWEGAEEWMPLAWELCAEECGEDACTELVWEGGPVPEPWGDRWLKYEDEAKRLIALVRKHVPGATPHPAPAAAEPVEAPTRDDLIAALQWYADGLHFDKASPDAWDTVSGEPQNWWCDEAGTATIEDGTIAKQTLAGKLTAEQINALEDGEDFSDTASEAAQAAPTPQPVQAVPMSDEERASRHRAASPWLE
jgi:hypothetical protein